MVKEIKETLDNEDNKGMNIKFIKRIDSDKNILTDTDCKLEDFDYYKVIETCYNGLIIMCWEDGDSLEGVHVFTGKYE